MHKLLFILFFLLINPVFAIEFNGKFIQGHFIIGKTNPNSQILIDKRKVKLTYSNKSRVNRQNTNIRRTAPTTRRVTPISKQNTVKRTAPTKRQNTSKRKNQ